MVTMDMRWRRRRGGPSGFTLIEVLVVMAIIVILVAGVVTVGLSIRQTAQRRSTMATMTMLDGMRADYEVRVGKAPQTGTGFWNDFVLYPDFKSKLTGLGTAYFDPSRGVLDGFGNPISFVTSPREGFQSNGPDGQPNTTDNIYSWDPK